MLLRGRRRPPPLLPYPDIRIRLSSHPLKEKEDGKIPHTIPFSYNITTHVHIPMTLKTSTTCNLRKHSIRDDPGIWYPYSTQYLAGEGRRVGG